MNSFRIFKPDNKFHLTNDKVLMFILIISVIPCIMELILFNNSDKRISTFSAGFIIFAPLAMLSSAILGFVGKFKYKPFRGELTGLIYFYIDRIIIEEHEYPINLIKKIEIYANDYSGKSDGHKSANWKISNGTDNVIKIVLIDDSIIVLHFQILKEFGILQIKEQLIHYLILGKISWLHVIDILCINDYDKIQEFKKVVTNIKENYAIPPRN